MVNLDSSGAVWLSKTVLSHEKPTVCLFPCPGSAVSPRQSGVPSFLYVATRAQSHTVVGGIPVMVPEGFYMERFCYLHFLREGYLPRHAGPQGQQRVGRQRGSEGIGKYKAVGDGSRWADVTLVGRLWGLGVGAVPGCLVPGACPGVT